MKLNLYTRSPRTEPLLQEEMRSAALNVAYDRTERVGRSGLVFISPKQLKDFSFVLIKLSNSHLRNRTGKAHCECREELQHWFAFVRHRTSLVSMAMLTCGERNVIESAIGLQRGDELIECPERTTQSQPRPIRSTSLPTTLSSMPVRVRSGSKVDISIGQPLTGRTDRQDLSRLGLVGAGWHYGIALTSPSPRLSDRAHGRYKSSRAESP